MGTTSTKENAPLTDEAKAKQLIKLRDKYKGESSSQQAYRLLEALRYFPVSTFEARKYLDVMHPAGRVQELREEGNKIETLRLTKRSEAGRPHIIALYVLRKEARP